MIKNTLIIMLLIYSIIITTSLSLHNKEIDILIDAYNNKEEFILCVKNYKGKGTGFKECGLVRLEDKMNTFEKSMTPILKYIDKLIEKMKN